MSSFLKEKKIGEQTFQYKLRDWLFSRQRYWGEPFPIIHGTDGSATALPLEELPVILPEAPNYETNGRWSGPISKMYGLGSVQ